ncbi:hypothetical protein [Microbulbifer sp. THAF38]|uniref:hypothetical protein n=1 Tax=Microbulbifer sp. THAF38 TaxID=2587856 RepID=UPI0012694557|nr:hypothetical protein [Microbulbifer sp. THAF38]QFT54264.1 hypothetical protein FIU95_06785 [Microbulbifer sp. THAF38]
MNKYCLSILVLFVAGCTTVPLDQERDSGNQVGKLASSPSQEGEPKSELVCKFRETTGSKFKKKVCMTTEEWLNDSEETVRKIKKLKRHL